MRVPRVCVGAVLGARYRVIEEIGSGVMGTVYLAEQLDIRRRVAVKVLHRHYRNNREVRARFDSEVAAVARLTHPHVVSLYDTGESPGGQPYLVMEYVEGATLEDILQVEGKPSLLRSLVLLRQMVAGLAAAHRAGVVHRDLKPANVLVADVPGVGETVKIVDFGVVKWMEEAPSKPFSAVTKRGSICGTPEYMAPEQALAKGVDHRADLYALGVMLYRLVTGRLPFEQPGIAVMMAHIAQSPEDVRVSQPHVPEIVASLIANLLAKDPAERPADAAEVARMLDEAIAEVTAHRRAQERRRSPGRLRAAGRSGATMLAFIALTAIGAAVFAHAAVGGDVPEQGKSWIPATGLLPRPAGSAARNSDASSVVIAGGSYSVRLVSPSSVALGSRERFYVDIWDRSGYPVKTALQVQLLAPSGSSSVVRHQPSAMPGRFVFDVEPREVGRHMISLTIGLDVEVAAYIEVDDQQTRS